MLVRKILQERKNLLKIQNEKFIDILRKQNHEKQHVASCLFWEYRLFAKPDVVKERCHTYGQMLMKSNSPCNVAVRLPIKVMHSHSDVYKR